MTTFKILIVDDVVENIQTIARLLEGSHPEYRLYQATGGQSAIDLVRSMKIDLIISDWDMPGVSGIDLARAVKADIRTRHIPIIIVSGVMLSSRDLQEALAAGAFDYIRKPVDPVELSARTHSALRWVSQHLDEIAQKNRELDEKTLFLIKSNEFSMEISRQLSRVAAESCLDKDSRSSILHIIEEIDRKIKEDSWQRFEIAFENVHPEFSRNLVTKYPLMTPVELRHCILIKLGMNIKDVASVLYLSPDSIKVTRSRIRKKLQIPNELSFNTFFSSF